MPINDGIYDTARVLDIGKDTIISVFKKLKNC